MATEDADVGPRPALRDIDHTLLNKLLLAETDLWLRRIRSSGIGNDQGLESCYGSESRESGSAGAREISSTLLRHGKQLQDIHSFFQKLIPRRYLMTLACHMEPDHFQVVEHVYRIPFTGTQAVTITYKESEKPLHPDEYDVYKCAFLAASYPVLTTSLDPSPTFADHIMEDSQDVQPDENPEDSRLTPTSKECMMYDKDPISPTSIFPVDSEVLTELVRTAFCLTQRRHAIYKTFIERTVDGDPAKILVEEMRELLAILNSRCHPSLQPNAFRSREDYNRWLTTETSEIQKIINEQQREVLSPEAHSLPTISLKFKDKHDWFKNLLAKLYRLESSHSQINIATNEAIPTKPLSPEASRLLHEFGERYRIGDLHRRISLLTYLARNFETKVWYCRYVSSVIQSILHSVKTEDCFITTREVEMFQEAVVGLHAYVKHSLSRINRLFPKNSPDGALRAVMDLLSLLVLVDQDETFGNHSGVSLSRYLMKCAKEEMRLNYERQKIIYADQLKLRAFGQQCTPRMINLMILDISEKLRSYRMYFKQEFIRYFDIVEMAVDVFYGLLMEDVLEMCDTYPVDMQPADIDYPMIALAYRLSSFDRDPAWEHYLSLEKQTWRVLFLKHCLSWINSLQCKLKEFVSKALQQDFWKGFNTEENGDLSPSETPNQGQQRARPEDISTPPAVTVSRATPSIAPSTNSAFVQVGSRSGTLVAEDPRSSTPAKDSGTTTTANRSPYPNGSRSSSTPGTSKSEDVISKTDTTKDLGPEDSSYSKISRRSSSLASASSRYAEDPSSTSRSYETADECFYSQSSDGSAEYMDARSNASDLEDVRSADLDAAADMVNGCHDNASIPVSSSLIDLLGGVNRAVAVVRHILRLVCSKHVTSRHDSLRLTPEECNETEARLDAGRVDLAKELALVLESVALVYGYYIMSAESRGVNDEVLVSIIGERCKTRLLRHVEDGDIRLCRHNTAGCELYESADSQGSCAPPCMPLFRTENTAANCEKVVIEMCVRVNNVRTLKNLLGTLIQNAVQTVLDPGSRPDIEHDVMSMNETPNLSSAFYQHGTPSTPGSLESQEAMKVIDTDRISKTLEELQEIEEGLLKLMAFRANAVIKQLLRLLLTLNLTSFNSRKRLLPVLNATRRTVHMLACNLYSDCFGEVLRHFWLAVVKDFEEEKENLVFLNGIAQEQSNLLLEAVSYFIEIFRAEKEAISLAFLSRSMEPILQSLNYYTLPTSSLIQMFKALQMRNAQLTSRRDSTSMVTRTSYRYQMRPSDVLIGRLRIELHSEHRYFSGRRFVVCVADQIRYEGDLRLGICAVQDGCDEDSAVTLGQYLLDNGVIRFFGKIASRETSADVDVGEGEDDDLDDELQSYNRPGSTLIIPGRTAPVSFFNQIPNYSMSSEQDHSSFVGSESSLNIIVDEDAERSSSFLNSENVLYRFESTDVEESFESCNQDYRANTASNSRTQDDITKVLFTRRNIERNANEFLADLGPNDVLQELRSKIRNYSISGCCWSSAIPL